MQRYFKALLLTNLATWPLALGAVNGASALATSDSEATPAHDGGTGLEEIVVTAQRREENQQRVPVALTALTQEQLTSRQVSDVGDLTSVAPNMSFGPAYDPTDIVIGIRGLSETIPELGVDPAVGVYVDGVYYALTAGANHAFIDMDRVEVLRGPQGTLFGRNTIGGALNITTHKPTDVFEGSAQVQVGNFDTRIFTGILNVPLPWAGSAVRFVYQHNEHSGYAHDSFLDAELNDARDDYGRATVKFQPAEDWQILLSADYFVFRGNSTFQKMAYYDQNPAIPPQSTGATGAFLNGFLPFANGHSGDLLTNYVGGGFYANQAGINPPTRVDQHSFTGTISGLIASEVNVKAIVGSNSLDRHEGTDTDGTPYAVLDIIDAPLYANQFSGELQFYGDSLDNRLQWIGGAYYFRLDGHQGDITNLFGGSPIGFQNYLSQDDKNHSDGAFTQVNYAIIPAVRVTLGARYTQDTREAENFDHVNTLGGAFVACSISKTTPAQDLSDCHLSGKASYSYAPWTAGIDFSPTSDSLVYAKISRGYRSGGFQQIAPTAPAPAFSSLPSFNPENVLTEEIGEKLELLDRRLRLNSAIFYSSYNNIQQSYNIATPNGPITVVQNVGKGRFYGGEFEATALIQKLILNASIGVTDPKFTEGPNVGLPVTNVSRQTVAVNTSYPIQFQAGKLTVSMDYNWRSREYFFEPIPGNAAQSAAVSQASFGLFDAAAKFDFASTRLFISLWGRNLMDKQYKARVTDFITGGLPYDAYIPGTPRTFGATLNYGF